MKQIFYKIAIMLFASCVVASASFARRQSKTGKLFSYTELGALCGNPNNENSAPFIFHSSLNYAFHKNLSAGIGAGLEFLKETYLPVTANVLYQFGEKKTITPFVRLQAGYQVALESNTGANDIPYNRSYIYNDVIYYPPTSDKLDSKGGFMANPSVGVIVYTRVGLGVSLSAGYRYQRLTYRGNKDYSLHIEYNRLSLALGIIF
jgi:hypothetical protein